MIRKFVFRIVATIMLAAGAVAAGAALPAGDAHAAANRTIVDDPDGKLSATEYFSMLAFVIPIIDSDVHKRQLTLVLAIGLFDDRDREDLKFLVPRFRDAIYQVLFNLISFRTAKPRIPAKSILERKLFPVVKKLGGDLVKSVKVHKLILEIRP